jgi:arylsulfatase A
MAAVCVGIACPALAADGNSRPNIVFMLADDQGWNGLSVPMAPDMPGSRSDIFQTPNLERLAAQGVRFSSAYAPAPVCSPARISIQTGKSPAQLHWTKAAPPEEGRKLLEPRLIKSIADSETTVGERLRKAGCATAHYGKWHIGGGGPGKHGYDEHDGDTGNEEAFQFTDPNPVDIFGMAERAATVIPKEAVSRQSSPTLQRKGAGERSSGRVRKSSFTFRTTRATMDRIRRFDSET